jgi:hypothetical protein
MSVEGKRSYHLLLSIICDPIPKRQNSATIKKKKKRSKFGGGK